MEVAILLLWFFSGIALGWALAGWARMKRRAPKAREDLYKEIIALGMGFTTWALRPSYLESLEDDLSKLRAHRAAMSLMEMPKVHSKLSAFIQGIDEEQPKKELTVIYDLMIDEMRLDLGIEPVGSV